MGPASHVRWWGLEHIYKLTLIFTSKFGLISRYTEVIPKQIYKIAFSKVEMEGPSNPETAIGDSAIPFPTVDPGDILAWVQRHWQ